MLALCTCHDAAESTPSLLLQEDISLAVLCRSVNAAVLDGCCDITQLCGLIAVNTSHHITRTGMGIIAGLVRCCWCELWQNLRYTTAFNTYRCKSLVALEQCRLVYVVNPR
jgi:hypothetical protein